MLDFRPRHLQPLVVAASSSGAHMAGIYQRGKTWWGRVERGGQEFRRSLETRSQSVARQRLAQWIDRLEAAAWGAKPRVTLNEIADRFITEHLPNIRPSAARRYGISLNHLDRELGHLMLDTIGSAELVQFETARRTGGASAPTIRRDLACLSSLFSFAIEREIVDASPVGAFLRRAKKRGLRESEPRTRYFSAAEETALIKAATRPATPPRTTAPNPRRRPTTGPRNDIMLRAAIIVAANSGLRLREQLDLTWNDVDLDRGVARISAPRAKGRRSRDVVLLPAAIEALQALPRHIKSRLVFWHRDGRRFRHFDRGFKSAARRAGIREARWHDLRRTHGCRLLQVHGWSIEMVQAQLGHLTAAQTQRAYAFLEVEQRLAAVPVFVPGRKKRNQAAGITKAPKRQRTQ
jgi:integrase